MQYGYDITSSTSIYKQLNKWEIKIERIKHDDCYRGLAPRLCPRLKNISRGFSNPLFGNLLSGEDQTVTNLPYTVKNNHNLLLGEDQTVYKSSLHGEE